MKINLIPKELEPTRPSLVPYLPFIGLAAISSIWLATQFVSVAVGQGELRRTREECNKIVGQLAAFKDLPARVTKAEQERDSLRLNAAAVTVLTHSGFFCSNILQLLAECTPGDLRLTDLSIDSTKGVAMLLGYGSEEKGDLEVTLFLRQLNSSKAILETFSGARLNFCNSAKQGETALKKFSISLQFREERMGSIPDAAQPASGASDGKKNGRKA